MEKSKTDRFGFNKGRYFKGEGVSQGIMDFLPLKYQVDYENISRD